MFWIRVLLLSAQIGLISCGGWSPITGKRKGPPPDPPLLEGSHSESLILGNIHRSVQRNQNKETIDRLDLFKSNEMINFKSGAEKKSSKTRRRKLKKNRNKGRQKSALELGVFVDEMVHRKLHSLYFKEEKINDVVLGLINQIQAIFKQSHLQVPTLDLLVTHMEIFETQPEELKMEGDWEALDVLTTFCNYQKKINDAKTSHWNMALYFTGKDLFTLYNGTKSTGTMGLSAIDGLCKQQHSCVIAEFGSVSSTGHPYLSSGWAASYIMAHEMGHNLGMLHDGYGNNCSRDGFLMSATRSFEGETTWSECSVSTLKRIKTSAKCIQVDRRSVRPRIDHMKFKLVPGQTWNANDQCKLFLTDDEAKQITIPIQDVCKSIKCVSRKKVGHYYAGPALDGTNCGPRKWCKSGKCVSNRNGIDSVKMGEWSEWQVMDNCTSGCLINAKGTTFSRRRCNGPSQFRRRNEEDVVVCDGLDVRVDLCDDSSMCGNRSRQVIESIANDKCGDYSKILPSKELTSKGGQMPYSKNRPWQSCTIFCKTSGGVWYTPKFDIVRSNETLYPDGTWCHLDEARLNYYCLNGECIPETNFHLHHPPMRKRRRTISSPKKSSKKNS